MERKCKFHVGKKVVDGILLGYLGQIARIRYYRGVISVNHRRVVWVESDNDTKEKENGHHSET